MWSLDSAKRHKMEIETTKIRHMFGDIIQLGINDNSLKNADLLVAGAIIAGAIESIPDLGDAINPRSIMQDSADFFHIFFNGIAT
jgi:hypothetical protein